MNGDNSRFDLSTDEDALAAWQDLASDIAKHDPRGANQRLARIRSHALEYIAEYTSRIARRKTKSVHNVPVSTGETESGNRPVLMISGAKTTNKPLKPVPAGTSCKGRRGALQSIVLDAFPSMGRMR